VTVSRPPTTAPSYITTNSPSRSPSNGNSPSYRPVSLVDRAAAAPNQPKVQIDTRLRTIVFR
jgi:hypothetical protein